MAKTIKEERLRWVVPIVQKEIHLVDAAKVCPYGKRSLERWVAAYREHGEGGLIPHSTEPKHCQGETAISLKERVIAIRKKTKKCALKIHWQLKKEGILIHERTVGKILKKESLVRKYRVKKIKYEYIKAERLPGELVELDVKYVPGRIAGKRYFQYTAIDTASRWRYIRVYGEQNGWNSRLFLKEVMRRFPHPLQAVKTDNGFIFTNRYTGTYKRLDRMPVGVHAFDAFCNKYNIIHYLIDPGKPAQNGTVERSHREDQEKLYGLHTFNNLRYLQRMLREWNMYYNNLEHCGLGGKSPNEFLAEYTKVNPPNVRT
ncbi:DDE-type integrase/transposase/recombinase [Patescibacteria group bacterium]|nr:DDE-type integrase/transposase/recombinase [Patescibacteria group bacterium]